MDWYFTIGTERKGPADLKEVKRLIEKGILAQSDFIWNATLGEKWIKISEVPILSRTAISGGHKKNSANVIDGKPSTAHIKRRMRLIKIVIAIAILTAALIIYKQLSQEKSAERSSTAAKVLPPS